MKLLLLVVPLGIGIEERSVLGLGVGSVGAVAVWPTVHVALFFGGHPAVSFDDSNRHLLLVGWGRSHAHQTDEDAPVTFQLDKAVK